MIKYIRPGSKRKTPKLSFSSGIDPSFVIDFFIHDFISVRSGADEKIFVV